MSSILEYIDQYGSYDFSEKEFNAVDGLILSQFSYLKVDEMVPKVGTECKDVLLKDILESEHYEDLYQDERYARNNRELFEKMAYSIRFGQIGLNHFINLVSKKWEMQFSAIVCYLPGAIPLVVFRGTDESVIGWKEDFNMAFLTPIPAQLRSIDYLNYVAERIKGEFNICGHSKGGNLAVYSAMKCSALIEERVGKIYSFDGPGFTKEALDGVDFHRIQPKICKLVPKSSIVGMLLQSQEEYSVVEAKKYGILQHDPFNWVVVDDSFVYVENINEMSVIHNKSINEWAENTNPKEMRQFIDQLYDVVTEVGITDLNDFKGNYPDILRKFTHAIDGFDDKQKELMREIFKSLMDSFIETIKSQVGTALAGERDKRGKRSI